MDGLTEGGKKLLADALEPSLYADACMIIIRECLDANGMRPENWNSQYFVNGVHSTDHKQGVTLDDYKYIKAHLMIIGRWE